MKLQIGVLAVAMYMLVVYNKKFSIRGVAHKWTLFDTLLASGLAEILLDAVTAYTVNHLDAVPDSVNLFLHVIFFLLIDAFLFSMMLYVMELTDTLPRSRKLKSVLYISFALNLSAVVLFSHDLDYVKGVYTNYSMGMSVYACYSLAAVYFLASAVILLRKWEGTEERTRFLILSAMIALSAVSVIQMIFPEVLITSIGVLLILLAGFLNHEEPALMELRVVHEEMVYAFANLVENRDEGTGGHIKRTTEYVKILAEELKKRGYYGDVLTRDYIRDLALSAPMHDIGKIAIPDSVLQKPGRLTPEEFDIIKTHTTIGARIIDENFTKTQSRRICDISHEIALSHHEKWNGRGYPYGLSGEQIPLSARIMAVSDVFDAVSEKRCYRDALPLDTCFKIIEDGSGSDFDPVIAEVFLSVRDQVEECYRAHA